MELCISGRGSGVAEFSLSLYYKGVCVSFLFIVLNWGQFVVEAFSFSISVRVCQLCCSLFCGCEPSCVCVYIYIHIYFGLTWMWTFCFYMFKYEDDLKFQNSNYSIFNFHSLLICWWLSNFLVWSLIKRLKKNSN